MGTTRMKPAGEFRRLLAGAALALMMSACGSGDSDDDRESGASETGSDAIPTVSTDVAQPSGNAREVGGERLAYAEVDERLVYGHFAFPLDMVEPLPAVIVIHDWWGLNDDVREFANRLAAEGFMVLAVDLYNGELATDSRSARAMMITVLEDPDPVEDNLRQALQFVSIAGAPQKAALGWGFGAGWSINATVDFAEEIDAAVVFYGQLPTDAERLAAINAPVLVLHGGRDRGIKVESVHAFEEAMQAQDKVVQIEIYAEAGHAFADPARQNYRAGAAADAWAKAVEFLATHLVASDAD